MSRVTALQFINSHDVALLMAGSDDGSVRIWKNYFNYNMLGREPTLLTAWQALADAQPVSKGPAGIFIENILFLFTEVL